MLLTLAFTGSLLLVTTALNVTSSTMALLLPQDDLMRSGVRAEFFLRLIMSLPVAVLFAAATGLQCLRPLDFSMHVVRQHCVLFLALELCGGIFGRLILASDPSESILITVVGQSVQMVALVERVIRVQVAHADSFSVWQRWALGCTHWALRASYALAWAGVLQTVVWNVELHSKEEL